MRSATRTFRTRAIRPLDAEARPSVTVVIPCFNYGRYLSEAVASAVTQAGVDVSVVIVDDCSTDDSLAVARALAERHSNVTVVAHAVNQGPVATFNDGLRLVSGEFLVRLDADDLLTPGSLARSTALALAHPGVGLVYGHPRHFKGDPPGYRSRVRSWTVWPGRQWLGDRCRDGYNVITAPEVLMRTSVVERVGGQMPLAHTHDMEMWLRMAAFSDVGRVDGADQAWHREHDASLSSRKVDRIKDLGERRAAFDVLFSGPAATIPEAATLQRLARCAIARDALREACHLLDRGKATENVLEHLTTIAREVAPAGVRLRGWKQLERRRRLGIDRVSSRPWYVAAAVGRRLRNELRRLHWNRTGVYGPSHDLPASPR